ncbi:hypothetical protein KUV64_22095 [Mameliella alba]|uniref:hypothetical protein n=1 Tax=Mameliella alba TaxID=561184 RepID=UPI001C94F622|nr:hypothetical protein [Mameliella alba]MBY6121830.1 hypothetical protein [Mameliella alba]
MSSAIEPIRAEVMAQPEGERLDYALALLELYLAPAPAFYTAAADLGLDLRASDVRVIYALERELGKCVTAERLIAARCIDRPFDEWETPDRVSRSLTRIKREIARIGLPLQIECLREVGYRMTAPAGWSLLRQATGRVAA